MANFFENLWESIFTPGPTPTLLVAANTTFAILQVLLLLLLIATYSIHFLALSFLSGGLWWAINWFARELREAQRLEQEEKARGVVKTLTAAADSSPSESETEVETTTTCAIATTTSAMAVPAGRREAGAKEAAAPIDEQGELRQRIAAATTEPIAGSATASTRSGMSTETEDEWEKVSENEKEKDR